MIVAVMAIHVIVSIMLIVSVLLHSGKGTGLSTTFTGGFSTFAGTTMMERYLDRITIVLSVIFSVTTLILVIYYR